MIMKTAIRALKELTRDRLSFLAGIVVLVLGLTSVIVPLVVPQISDQNLLSRLLAPSWTSAGGQGLMGTDPLGRDLLLRSILGVRASILISLGAITISFVVGSALGMWAGFRRGRVESIIVLATDIQLSFPALLVAIILATTVGQGAIQIVLILGLSYWMIFARMARQATLTVSASEFVEASKIMGGRSSHILKKHVFRNVLPTLVGVATIEFARVMLAEASLSFLGFGLQPPDVSIGLILASGHEYIGSAWWIATFSGLVLTLLVLSVNTFGTWLHGYLDPAGITKGLNRR